MGKGESTTVVRRHPGWSIAEQFGLVALLLLTWALFQASDHVALRVMQTLVVAGYAFWVVLRARTRVQLVNGTLQMHGSLSVAAIPLEKCAGLSFQRQLWVISVEGRPHAIPLVAEGLLPGDELRPSVRRAIAELQELAPLSLLPADDVAALRKAHGFRDGGKMMSPYQRIRIEIVPWQWAALAVVAALLATIWIATS